MEKFARLLASGFGIGYWPKAPGTWASAYTAGFAFLIQIYLGNIALLVFAALVCILCVWVTEQLIKKDPSLSDPSWIVLDEVAGQSIVFAYVFDRDIWLAILAFAAFRFFDILKPWPISVVDRKMTGSLGVLLDDVVAGILAGLVVYLVQLYLL